MGFILTRKDHEVFFCHNDVFVAEARILDAVAGHRHSVAREVLC
jgi:hypothetical protein